MPIALCALASCCRPYIRVLLPYLNGLFFRVKRQINKWTASLPNSSEYFRNGRRNCHCPGICLSTCLPGEVNGTWTPVSEEEYIRGPENHSGWGRIAAGTAGYTVYNRWSGSTKILVHGKPFLQRNNSETVKYTKIWVCAWSVSCTILCETWQMVCWLPVTRRNCMVASRARRPEICERTNENPEKTEYDRHARLWYGRHAELFVVFTCNFTILEWLSHFWNTAYNQIH